MKKYNHFQYLNSFELINQLKANPNDNNNIDKETFNEILDILNKVIKIYNDDYVYKMIEDNRKDDFVELISRININMLAKVYCEVNGSEFTNDEKEILSSELSQAEKSTLSDAISGRKK